ncbi:retrovirus-related pol polyprotein from transposon TNT 1-94 [Tanacetum coccineum]
MGVKDRRPSIHLGRKRVNSYAARITKVIADIEDRHHGPRPPLGVKLSQTLDVTVFRSQVHKMAIHLQDDVPTNTHATPGIDGIPPPREEVMETYVIVSEEIRKKIDAETEAVHIILTRIDNDIYSTVDACPNAMEMWKAIERLKQEPEVVVDDEASLKEKEIDKIMALISMSFKKIYKPTHNNLRTSSNTKNMNVDNTPRFDRRTSYDKQTRQYDNQRAVNVVGDRDNVRDSAYHKEKMMLYKQEEAGIQLSAEQADWRDDTDDEPKDLELEAHYMYMAKIQEVILDAVDNSGPIFDTEPLEKHDTPLISDLNNKPFVITDLKAQLQDKDIAISMVRFGNDQFAPILGYGDLVQANVTIKRVYYVEGMNHNLFFVGQFCDADLEVAFRKSSCHILDLKGNDLLTGSRGTYLYSITLQETTSANPICLMAKALSSQAWLWHRHLSHLNFDTINLLSKNDIVNGLSKLKFVKDHLCSSCELGKAKRSSFKTKTTASSNRRTTSSTSTTVAADLTQLDIQTTHEPTTQEQTVNANENINQAENAQVDEDEFINIFGTPVHEVGESSSHRVNPSNMHTFYQRHPSEYHWTKDHPLEQVLGNPSQPALYGLKQAPRAWYDELSKFLVSKGFSKGSIDPTLFITKHGEDILLMQIYVDDIIFRSINPKLSKKFKKLMHNKFEMSMIGELKKNLGLQIHQSPRGIFIDQAKYAQEILKKHGMTSCDSIGTPMAAKRLDADLSGTPIN